VSERRTDRSRGRRARRGSAGEEPGGDSAGDGARVDSGASVADAVAAHTPRDELAETTAHGEVYLRRLRQAQLSLSVTALIAFGALFGVLPIALYLLHGLRHVRLFGVPISDWLLIVPLYPVIVGIGFLYARRADALDESFRELVRRR
jgi:hypothetical protein